MTAEQRDEVVRLRHSGFSYEEVAASVGMKPTAIKTFCHRNGLTDKAIIKAELETERNFCPHCGKPITQIPKQKPKRFCSEQCRLAWWKAHKGFSQKKAFYKTQCTHCGKEFISYGNNKRKYCSRQCYFVSRFGDRRASAGTGAVSL